MAINKKYNEYSNVLKKYDKIPKAVLAAIAVSFAHRIEQNMDMVETRILSEWNILHQNGIIPQKPYTH